MKVTKRLKVDNAFDKPAPPVTTHLGRAGEYFVAAQLLRMGYNTSPLPVDTGVDLLAHWVTKNGDSRVALLQVKSTASRRTTIRLNKTQLDRITGQGVNLVVVFTDLGPMVNRFDLLAATDEDPHAILNYAEWTSDEESLLRIVPDEDTQPNKRIQPTARRAHRG